jgi:hypothetical protein
MNRLAPALAAGLLLAACSRPQPSPEYERARALWTEIVKARADDASQDPRADEVLALLGQVPPASADAAAAAELRGRIEADRKARVEERERRDRLVAQAAAPHDMPSAGAAAGGGGGGGSEPQGGADAGPTPEVRVGMSVAELEKQFGDCFSRREAVRIGGGPDGGARDGDLWVMKDDAGCRERHAALAGQGILVAAGQVAGVSPLDKARKVEVRRVVELAPLPDGGTGMRVDGGVVPLPPGATVTPLDGGAR